MWKKKSELMKLSVPTITILWGRLLADASRGGREENQVRGSRAK